MLILSHRGFHESAPENTLAAFAEAVTMGVDGIETDVRLSADGLPIIFHNRVAPDGRAVASLTQSELSALVGYEVPTLDRVLASFDGILWNIEIKTPSAFGPTLDILKQYHSSRRLLVTSFWHNVVEQVKAELDIDCGIVVRHHPPANRSIQDLLPPPGTINTIVWHYEIIDPSLLHAAAQIGIRNFVYDAALCDEQQTCADLDIDGLITDRPDILRS
jgi:glycerophosphoryl diester phosphodiesterase